MQSLFLSLTAVFIAFALLVVFAALALLSRRPALDDGRDDAMVRQSNERRDLRGEAAQSWTSSYQR